MKTKTKLLTVLFAMMVMLVVLAGPASASIPPKPSAVSENNRPNPMYSYLIAGVLGAGIVVVSIKSAKRSHLD